MRGVLSLVMAFSLTTAAQAAATIGQLAPDCALNLAGQNAAISLHQLRGKAVYVDFWASWCAPCLLSFPFMASLQQDFRDQGLEVVAINTDRSRRDAERFLERRPAAFPIAFGPNADCARKFGLEIMPTSYLIGKDGVIRLVHTGFKIGDEAVLRAAVERSLAAAPSP